MQAEPEIYVLLDSFGTTPAGFARFALIATDPESEPTQKADALWAMGFIARHFEIDLSIDETGLPFFVQARKYDPVNVRVCCEILSLYKDPPDGHSDEGLAAECLAILDGARETMHPTDRGAFDDKLRSMRERAEIPAYQKYVVDFDALRRHPRYRRINPGPGDAGPEGE